MIVGESFQVQYILEDGDKNAIIMPTTFPGFRIVVGPQIYEGNMSTPKGMIPVKNAVYTLEALRPGKFIIAGATALTGTKTISGLNVIIEVISKRNAAQLVDRLQGNDTEYYLRPGENVQQKIAKNLFVKVAVNKQTCFIGEAILATFKLYSRLQSKSDIIKNPGFYGFTVYDMENLQDKVVAEENINGKRFDVHTIRKVQLYPLQPGVFTIDAMQIKNIIQFSRSAINKKPEQEIIEGIQGFDEKENISSGTEIFENEISTTPITITVKPLPEKNKPTSFSGAVGSFTISSSINKKEFYKNEQGFLEVVVQGSGNFTQLDAPVIIWPDGIEGFEPSVNDNIIKTELPLTGSRIFRYPFVSSRSGSYELKPVSFSFYNKDSNNYKTLFTLPVAITISTEEQKKDSNANSQSPSSIVVQSEKAARIAVVIVVVIVLSILFYWIFKKKEKLAPVAEIELLTTHSPKEVMKNVNVDLENAADFYAQLYNAIWKYFSQRFSLSGSQMNKQWLRKKLTETEIGEATIDELITLLSQCESGMFTNANLELDKELLRLQAIHLLEKIDSRIAS